MQEYEEKYRGKGIKFIVFFSLVYIVVGVLDNFLNSHESHMRLIPSMIPLLVIIPISILASKHWDIILRENGVEGPPVKGNRRILIPYKEINQEKTRLPSFWRKGYIEAEDERRILLNYVFFTKTQIVEIIEKITYAQ